MTLLQSQATLERLRIFLFNGACAQVFGAPCFNDSTYVSAEEHGQKF